MMTRKTEGERKGEIRQISTDERGTAKDERKEKIVSKKT